MKSVVSMVGAVMRIIVTCAVTMAGGMGRMVRMWGKNRKWHGAGGQRIRFVDLHYKGVRIRQGWKYLLLDTALMFGVVAAVLAVAIFYIGNGESLELGGVVGDMGRLAREYLFPALVVSVLLVCVSFPVCYPLWNHLSDLQRLCRMVYTYPLYLVRNYASAGALQGKDAMKVVREIEYFPNIYYRVRGGEVEITVELDGSQFHQDGTFEDLTKVLEDSLVLNVVNISQRRQYLTYHLFRDAELHRLGLGEVVPEGYSIPLMHGVAWRVDKVPHALIVGATGGGKSYFLNALIRAFLCMGSDLYICDPKNSALADYGRILPHVESSLEGIQGNLEKCVGIMVERQAAVKGMAGYIPGQDFTSYGLSPVVLVLDEYTAYVSALDRKGKEAFKADLTQIVLKGREAGVFVVLATQRPDASALDGNIRDQLGLRVALGSMSEDGYRMTFGASEQKLRRFGGPGKGYMYMAGLQYIQQLCAPLVPPRYDFIGEAAKLLEGRGE